MVAGKESVESDNNDKLQRIGTHYITTRIYRFTSSVESDPDKQFIGKEIAGQSNLVASLLSSC